MNTPAWSRPLGLDEPDLDTERLRIRRLTLDDIDAAFDSCPFCGLASGVRSVEDPANREVMTAVAPTSSPVSSRTSRTTVLIGDSPGSPTPPGSYEGFRTGMSKIERMAASGHTHSRSSAALE